MANLKLRFFTIFAGIAFILGSSFFVLKTEKDKKYAKYLADQKYYKDQADAWTIYKNEYETQVQALVEENKKKMADSKAQYDALLAKQPDIIKQHTKTVADGSYVPPTSSNSIGAVVSSGGTTTKTIKVSKPKTSTSTKSS